MVVTMRYRDWLSVSILLVLIQHGCAVDDRYCAKSLETMGVVQMCPTTKAEMEETVKNKNCVSYAGNQSCSDPGKFKYHCVINVFRNETIEVCAPERKINGYCTEFNVDGARIQGHYGVDCTTLSPPCPQRYKSTDAYMYTVCYNQSRTSNFTSNSQTISSNNFESTSQMTEKGVSPEMDMDEFPLWIIVMIIVIAIPLGLIATFMIVRRYKRKKPRIRKQRLVKETETTLRNEESSPLVVNEFEVKTIRLPIQEGTTTDIHSFIVEKSREDISEEIIETTNIYLKCYTTFNKYFVETEMFKAAKACLDRNSVVIMTGPPGSGKTIAAIHLLFEARESKQVLLKIRSWEDFVLVDQKKETTVFIDNIFNETDNDDLKSWWDKLDEIFNKFMKNETEGSGRISSKKLHLIITARENVIENACTFMKRPTPVLNGDFIKHSKDFPLTNEEKDEIFGKQIEFAMKEKHMAAPTGDTEKFRKDMKDAKGPIGFPFCAHLYACKEDYRQGGAKFFSHPIEFLKIQITEEVRHDETPKTKTLFFVVFLFEWHLKMQVPCAKLNLGSEVACRRFVSAMSADLLQIFNPLDFKDLTRCAQKLSGAFFKDVGGGGFRYVHDSVFEAVGRYLCDTFFEEAVRFFPFDIIQVQDYSSLDKQQNHTLATRFLNEALNGGLLKVFGCKVFRRKSFVDCFCEELERESVFTDITSFFSVQNGNSNVRLPTLFLAIRNNHDYLTYKLYNIIQKHEAINTDYQFYLSMYGECCSKTKSLVAGLNDMIDNNLEEIKRQVIGFEDEDQNTILHLLVMSDRSDRHVADAIVRLEKAKANINGRNDSIMTPLMLAARHKSIRTTVIRTLINIKAEVKYKDRHASNVFHHCLKSDNNDEICARNLRILLSGNRSKNVLNNRDNDGESALNIAAKQQKYSRILSILMLLEYKDINTSTLNLDGCSPIHNVVKQLIGNSPLVELECCARVIILTLYGADPKKVADDQTGAVDICCTEYLNVQKVLKNPWNIEIMESALDDLIQNVVKKEKDTAAVELPNLSDTLPEGIKERIKQAVQLLATVEFKL